MKCPSRNERDGVVNAPRCSLANFSRLNLFPFIDQHAARQTRHKGVKQNHTRLGALFVARHKIVNDTLNKYFTQILVLSPGKVGTSDLIKVFWGPSRVKAPIVNNTFYVSRPTLLTVKHINC